MESRKVNGKEAWKIIQAGGRVLSHWCDLPYWVDSGTVMVGERKAACVSEEDFSYDDGSFEVVKEPPAASTTPKGFVKLTDLNGGNVYFRASRISRISPVSGGRVPGAFVSAGSSYAQVSESPEEVLRAIASAGGPDV